jgi:hypothetical protein
MVEAERDQLTEMLDAGWSIQGYSDTIMAAGAMTHSILLRKENQLAAVTIVRRNGKEMGRTINPLAPMPPPQMGWFG